MIEASDLTKRYGPFLALDRLNFSVERGRVVGFLGLNGAGKTTTQRIVSCFMPPSSGWVKVAGYDSVRDSEKVRQKIGYLPERVPLYDDLRVAEYLRYRAKLKGVRGKALKEAVERVIGQCGLESKRCSPIGTLSKGYRQRVGVADALVHSPDLLILDEPTSGLDPDQRRELRGLIKELGDKRTVFLSTHILPEAEAVCDDVIIIHRGQIRASDRLDDLRKNRDRGFLVRHDGTALSSYGNAKPLDENGNSSTDGIAEVRFSDQETASAAVAHIVNEGRKVLQMTPLSPTLEDIFIALTTGREEAS